MKERPSTKFSCFELARLLTLVALVSLCIPTPQSAQQDNRQLSREQALQTNRASEHRVALVIGNGAYANAPPLKNPPNDARDMAATLKDLGFEVVSGINVSQREMKRLIRDFGQKLKGARSGLFYYAGHGLQSKGRNYLVPIDADIQSEAEVEDSGVDVNLVLNYMDEAQNSLNIVILDACRNNPFARSFRSASEGLAQVDAPTGTLIAYATAPGRVASDGSGQNGLYTAELLRQMKVPGLSATEMFMHVRAAVMRQTTNKQVPWEASSLVGAFYFSVPTNNAQKSTGAFANETGIDPAFELSYWESIKASSDPEDFKAYIEKYPNGQFLALARNSLRRLEAASMTAVKVQPTTTSPPEKATSGTAYSPQLAFTGPENFQNNGKNYVRYRLSVTNRAVFPNEMFVPSPDLPPCGRNTKSSRTWVDIFDKTGKRYYGFCALSSSDELANLWFALAEGEVPPSSVYVVLMDRRTNTKYTSTACNITSPAAYSPQLAFTGQENYQSNGKNYVRYKLSVTNRAVFPNEMFAPAPDLPPCGLNTKSSRTWVDIFDGTGKRFYGFCALTSSDWLAGLWFALAEGEVPPSSVYVVLKDRRTTKEYKSNLATIH